MYEYLQRKLLERSFAMADETPLQVLHEESRRAQTKSYMWLFHSGEDGGVPIILYKYSPTRAGDNAVEFLRGFKGFLMCDGYSGYNKVPDTKRTACWKHIRRYLTEVIPKRKQLDYKVADYRQTSNHPLIYRKNYFWFLQFIEFVARMEDILNVY